MDTLEFSAFFGELIFGDGIFGTNVIILTPTWIKQCPVTDDWTNILPSSVSSTKCEG